MQNTKVAILAACSIMMAPMALSPVIAEISRAFPDAPTSSVQLITVLPGMISLPFSLVAGKLATFMTKKSITLLSMTVLMLGGLIPTVLHDSVAVLLLTSAIIGVGLGFLGPMPPSLTADYFTGHERSTMMGLQATLVNAGGMVFALLGGLLARQQWHSTYFIFLLVLPVALVFALLLPPGKVTQTVAGSGHGLNASVAYLTVAVFFYGLFSTVYFTNIALYLDATHLGDAASAGIALAASNGVGIICGITFGPTLRRFERFTLPLALTVAAIGLLMATVDGNLVVLILASMFLGYGVSTLMPYGTYTVTQSVAPAATSLAAAVFMAGISIGSFASPFVVNALAGLTGDSTEKGRFIVGAIGMVVLTAVILIHELRRRKTVCV
ncbi:MAG TPA: MFS transporter [Anaerolineae bacterium]|jgi:MFS family permease